MTINNLALVLGPSILRKHTNPSNKRASHDSEDVHEQLTVVKVVDYLIRHHADVFMVPGDILEKMVNELGYSNPALVTARGSDGGSLPRVGPAVAAAAAVSAPTANRATPETVAMAADAPAAIPAAAADDAPGGSATTTTSASTPASSDAPPQQSAAHAANSSPEEGTLTTPTVPATLGLEAASSQLLLPEETTV